MRGRTLKEYIAEQMKDPEFKKGWDDLDPEFAVLEAMIKAREKSGMGDRCVGMASGFFARL